LLFSSNYPFNSLILEPDLIKYLYFLKIRAKNENKVLLGLRVKGEGLRRVLSISPLHLLFHSIFQSVDLTTLEPCILFLF